MTAGTYTATKPIYPDSPVKDSLENGAQFLDFIMLTLHKGGIVLQPFQSKKYQYEVGESIQGWEVKFDSNCSRTQRLSIEYAEKTSIQREWVPSGFMRNDNTWLYIQGNYDFFFLFMKPTLRWLYQMNGKSIFKWEIHEEYGTVKAFYLPLDWAETFGKKIIPGNK